MLLHLFVAQTGNEILSANELVARIDVARGVGRRWLRHLISDGQVLSQREGADVMLTAPAADMMRSFLDAAMAIIDGDNESS